MTKRLLLVLMVVWSLTVSLAAQWAYLAYEQIAVPATSTGITATVLQPNGANTAPQATVGVCRVQAAQIRWRVDGVAPTATVGTIAEIGDVIPINGADALQKFRMIRTGSTSASVDCTVAQR